MHQYHSISMSPEARPLGASAAWLATLASSAAVISRLNLVIDPFEHSGVSSRESGRCLKMLPALASSLTSPKVNKETVHHGTDDPEERQFGLLSETYRPGS